MNKILRTGYQNAIRAAGDIISSKKNKRSGLCCEEMTQSSLATMTDEKYIRENESH